MAWDGEVSVTARGGTTADGQPWVLQEVEASPGAQPLTVKLQGSVTPQRGVAYETSIRLVKHHYPGNVEPSVKVMGLTYEPIVLTGTMRDDQMGTSPADFNSASFGGTGVHAKGGARFKYLELRAIQAQQKRCYLTWGDFLDVSGYIEHLKILIERESWLKYELTFNVVKLETEAAAKPLRAFSSKMPASLIKSALVALAVKAAVAANAASAAAATIANANKDGTA